MADFQLEEDKEWAKYQQSYWDQSQHMPILVRLLMKTGVERRTSYYILFGIAIICSFATFEIIRRNFFSSQGAQINYIEDIPPEIKKTLPPEVLNKIPSRKN
jgi:hypothetical protein